MKDFLSVKEFSRLSGIEQTTLRYWDNIGLFSPIKRDPENNYRYYSPEQIIAVNFISVLSSLNIPLKTIGDLEKKRTPASIVRLIEQQQKLLDMEMCRLREQYSIIHKRLELINFGLQVIEGFPVADGLRLDAADELNEESMVTIDKISVLHLEDAAMILGPRNEFAEGTAFYEPFMRFCNQAEALRINLNFPIGGCHETMESFLKAPDQPDFFFSIDPTGNEHRVAGQYLVGFCRGYYGQFCGLAEQMAAYAKEHSLTISGRVYAAYLHDEICVDDPSQYLSQVCVKVSK